MINAESAADPRIEMLRDDLEGIPQCPLPEGFSAKPMTLRDVSLWTDIWRDVEETNAIRDSLFEDSFGQDWGEIARRCHIVLDAAGRSAGTISAWFDKDASGKELWGRVHYVAVRRAYQGKGLGRAMLSFALRRLAELGHKQAFLVTQTYRPGAIKLYLDYGFLPKISSPGALDSWREVAEGLPHPALLEFLGGIG